MILIALFHDLGKFATYAINPDTGKPTAHGHEDVSATITTLYSEWISQYDGVDFDLILFVVKNHMRIKRFGEMRSSKQRKLMDSEYFGALVIFSMIDSGGITM